MTRFNPRVDIAFKKIFGVEENKDLLISLVNAVVSEEDQVLDLTLLNPYNPKNFRKDKLSILDIKAVGHNNRRFNIEIQLSDEGDYDKRALYYWGKLYTEQLKEKDDYNKLSKAIGIHILNFDNVMFSKKYHNVFHITEQESGIRYFTDLELHTIELKKFASNDDDINDLVSKIQTSLDMWSAFLLRNDLMNKEDLPDKLNNPTLKKALDVLDVMNFNEEERDSYEGQLKWMRMENSVLNKFGNEKEEIGFSKGKIEGIVEGELKGKTVAS